MRTIALLGVALFAMACRPNQWAMTYFEDERTGLCFAEAGLGQNATLASVPCTPEVRDLIETRP